MLSESERYPTGNIMKDMNPEKRRHVNKFKEDVYPDKELVKDLLYKSES